MKKLFKLLFVLAAVVLICAVFTACGKETADPAIPSVKMAQRINATDIEIYIIDEYTGKTPSPSQYEITDEKGNVLEMNKGYGYGKTVYFDNMLTVSLAQPVEEGENAPQLYVVFEKKKTDVPYSPYYKYETTAACGVTVKGGRTLIQPEKTLKRAAEMVDVLLSKSQFLADKMVESGCFLAVYGPGEHAYYIPEHRQSYDESMLYVEGFGGQTCSITEANVWHWLETTTDKPNADYWTKYWDENILVHEFSHGIKLQGIDLLSDQSLADEFQMVYRHAKAADLWPNSYAISNSDEFFATLSTIWFNVMNESGQDDYWDGVRGPVNTRDELYNYDIDSYKFFCKIYPFTDMGENWDAVGDKCTITDIATEKAVEFEEDYTFNYPSEAVSSGGINYTDSFKIVYNPSGHIIDTNATSAASGLWWDYASSYPDTCGPMTFTFEQAEPVQTQNGTDIHTVYIKNADYGYMGRKNGRLVKSNNAPTVFTIEADSSNTAKIYCDEGFLAVSGTPADGTVINITDKAEDSLWRIEKLNKPVKIVFTHNASANGSENGAVAEQGDTVTLTAQVPDGKTFTQWKVSGGEVKDISSPVTELVMPDNDVVVWALYE